jgi:hypothetical protein
MKFSLIKKLVAMTILAGIIFFFSIVLTNILINKIPLPGTEVKLSPDSISGFNYSLKFLNKVVADDPERNHLLTEDKAWEHAWSYYHEKQGMTIVLPLEKRNLGLSRFSDRQNVQYTAWCFNVIQNDHRLYFYTGFKRGGIICIDAYSGNVLSFDEVS